MRSESPRGAILNKVAAQAPTTTVADIVAATIDVPAGWVALLTGIGLIAPAANTVSLALWVDGSQAPNSTSVSTGAQILATIMGECPPGKHRIALRVNASSNAGQVSGSVLSWMIVRRDVA